MTDQLCERSYRDQRSRLWLPPGPMPSAGQVIGSPYVWDGSDSSPVKAPVPNRADARSAERAVIGDELREVGLWCELRPCVARYTDAGATGHADIVARALAEGWRKDAFGRLICPSCLQRFPIWSAAPLVPGRQRYEAPRR